MYISTRRLYWEYYICMNACMYVCIMYVCMFVLQSAPCALLYRRADRRAVWCMCPKLNMHILRMYVYIDAPIILGVLYMYECMHVCMYYVCMYVCTPIGAIDN